jgi:hypothetical protein
MLLNSFKNSIKTISCLKYLIAICESTGCEEFIKVFQKIPKADMYKPVFNPSYMDPGTKREL